MTFKDNQDVLPTEPNSTYHVPPMPNTGEKPSFPKLRTIGGACSVIGLGLLYAFHNNLTLNNPLCKTTRKVLTLDGEITTHWRPSKPCMEMHQFINNYHAEITAISVACLIIAGIALVKYRNDRKEYKEIVKSREEYKKNYSNKA